MSQLYTQGGVTSQRPSVDTLLQEATSHIGGKYVYGGTNFATGVDCSGFTQQLFQQMGLSIGRDTGAQRSSNLLTDVQGGLAAAQPGDLLFFGDTVGPNAHVGIYLGNGKMISAENPQDGIQVADISSGSFGSEQLNQIRRANGISPDVSYNYGQTPATSSGSSATIGGSAPTETPAMTPDKPFDPNDPNIQSISPQDMAWVKQNAGNDLWMLADPELSKILAWVGHYQITDTAEVTAMVAQTNWYKTHSAQQRSWQQLYASDPQEAAREIQQAQANITAQAAQAGIKLSQDQLNQLAINYNYYGWTSQELQRAIGAYSTTAAPSASLATLQQSANQYLVQVPDATLQGWLTGINSGTMTQENVDAQLKQLAAGKFPWMAQQIQAGMTPQQILGPYASEIASTLQIDPSNINFNDTRWAKLTYNVDPKTGQQVQTPLWQSVQQVKQDPTYGWAKTPDGQNAQYDTAAQLTKLMGAVA